MLACCSLYVSFTPHTSHTPVAWSRLHTCSTSPEGLAKLPALYSAARLADAHAVVDLTAAGFGGKSVLKSQSLMFARLILQFMLHKVRACACTFMRACAGGRHTEEVAPAGPQYASLCMRTSLHETYGPCMAGLTAHWRLRVLVALRCYLSWCPSQPS